MTNIERTFLIIFAVIVFFALMFVWISPASAQNACFERGALIKHLKGKFNEDPVAAGLAANGSVLEVFTSPEGITWTIVLTQPNGTTCVMASGESWMGLPAPVKGKVS